MRVTIILTAIVLLTIVLTSCDDFTGPERWAEGPYIAITGNLHHDQPITLDRALFVGRTVDVDGGNANDMFVTDATVYIRDITPGADHSADTLAFAADWGDEIRMGFVDPDGSLIPQQRHRYRLVAHIPGLADSVWAETVVPDTIRLVPDEAFSPENTPPLPELVWETANTQHPLKVETQSDSVMYMYFEVYCLEEFSTDLRYTMDGMGLGEGPENEDEYEDPAGGWPRKNDWAYRYQAQLDPADGKYYILDRGYRANIWFYGRYEFTIYHIDSNYWHYLYKPEGYRHGGIHNGVGWFGAVSGQKMYTNVIE